MPVRGDGETFQEALLTFHREFCTPPNRWKYVLPASLTVRPSKFKASQKESSLPTIIFQGRAVKLRWCQPKKFYKGIDGRNHQLEVGSLFHLGKLV